MATAATERTAPGGERARRADARRNHQRLLEAAHARFAAEGLEAQINEIARDAGVGVGTVYRHFPTKEALLGELVRQRFAVFTEHAREALADDGDPFEAFAGVLRRNCELMADDAGTRHALTGADDNVLRHAADQHDELLAVTGKLIRRAQRAGSIRRDATTADVNMLMCAVGATMGNDIAQFDWRRHLELVLDSLRPRP